MGNNAVVRTIGYLRLFPGVRKVVSKDSAQSKNGVLEDKLLDASTHPPQLLYSRKK
jgi:hypothetical protein